MIGPLCQQPCELLMRWRKQAPGIACAKTGALLSALGEDFSTHGRVVRVSYPSVGSSRTSQTSNRFMSRPRSRRDRHAARLLVPVIGASMAGMKLRLAVEFDPETKRW